MKIKVISTSVSKKGNKFMQVQVIEGELVHTETVLEIINPPKPMTEVEAFLAMDAKQDI